MRTDHYAFIGMEADDQSDIHSAVPWLESALNLLPISPVPKPKFSLDDVQETLAMAYYQINNLPKASALMHDLMSRHPDDARITANMAVIQAEKEVARLINADLVPMERGNRISPLDNRMDFPVADVAQFHSLCRGEHLHPPSTRRVCYPHPVPWLRMTGRGVEQVLPESRMNITLVRGFLTHGECDELVTQASVHEALDVGSDTFYATSIHWIKPQNSPLATHIINRAGDAANLDMRSAGDLQIVTC